MDIQISKFKGNTEDTNVKYKNLVNTFRKVVGKHALIKYKIEEFCVVKRLKPKEKTCVNKS